MDENLSWATGKEARTMVIPYSVYKHTYNVWYHNYMENLEINHELWILKICKVYNKWSNLVNKVKVLPVSISDAPTPTPTPTPTNHSAGEDLLLRGCHLPTQVIGGDASGCCILLSVVNCERHKARGRARPRLADGRDEHRGVPEGGHSCAISHAGVPTRLHT